MNECFDITDLSRTLYVNNALYLNSNKHEKWPQFQNLSITLWTDLLQLSNMTGQELEEEIYIYIYIYLLYIAKIMVAQE